MQFLYSHYTLIKFFETSRKDLIDWAFFLFLCDLKRIYTIGICMVRRCVVWRALSSLNIYEREAQHFPCWHKLMQLVDSTREVLWKQNSFIQQGLSYATPWIWILLVDSMIFYSECVWEPPYPSDPYSITKEWVQKSQVHWWLLKSDWLDPYRNWMHILNSGYEA